MSNYVSKKSDSSGQVLYTEQENETWQTLINRQMQVIENRACSEFIEGLKKLSLPYDRVPQCGEVSEKLKETTGWSVKPVEALISLKEFFHLLANKQFPAATFIRKREELDYLKEPDIFHEFFGHCPLLTNQAYADYVEWYGKTALNSASEQIQSLLGRLFWFTVEFGLIHSKDGLRIYGGGILSSYQETVFALESTEPKRLSFDIETILKTHYKYDEIQERYFVLNNLNELYKIQETDIISLATGVAKEDHQEDFNIC